MGRMGRNLLGRGNNHSKGVRMPDRFGRKDILFNLMTPSRLDNSQERVSKALLKGS